MIKDQRPKAKDPIMQITITTPREFNFKRTALSHGWYDLLPFEFDEKTWSIVRVLDAGLTNPVTAVITATKRELKINVPVKNLSQRAVEKIKRDVRHIFRLDDDLSEFYDSMKGDADFAWVASTGSGRLLRSPTVFEDLVKTICTTNCSWALTDKMVKGLVQNIGIKTKDGRRSFPTPEAMANESFNFYKDVIRAGYRAPYFKELAEKVASGELNVESWLSSDLPTKELMREMKKVKGVGPYAAEHMLRMLGRYDGLALDSWVRATFAKKHNGGNVCPDKKIEKHYDRFGAWRGLALWCDMTQDWHED
jgi:N-glycosylase/DNA lyase